MRRSLTAPAVVILLSAVAGAWLLQRGIDRSDNMYVRVRVLQEVVDRVEASFVEEVDGESLTTSRDRRDPERPRGPALVVHPGEGLREPPHPHGG